MLLATKHRLAYPPLTKGGGLIWVDYTPKKGKDGKAVACDTWESYKQKWDDWQSKCSIGPFSGDTDKEKTIHRAYECLSQDLRVYVQTTPGAYPQTLEQWTWEYIGKTVKPYLDSGAYRAANQTKVNTKKLTDHVNGVRQQQVAAVPVMAEVVELPPTRVDVDALAVWTVTLTSKASGRPCLAGCWVPQNVDGAHTRAVR